MTIYGASRRLDDAIVAKHRLGVPRLPHISLTLRLFILVLIAVLPAIVIQGYNEYELRKAREADIRQQVIQITKQFGEEMGELREGARQLLLALSQLPAVQGNLGPECSQLVAALKTKFPNYGVIGAADAKGKVFCASRAWHEYSVAEQAFFKRAMQNDGVAVGNYFV